MKKVIKIIPRRKSFLTLCLLITLLIVVFMSVLKGQQEGGKKNTSIAEDGLFWKKTSIEYSEKLKKAKKEVYTNGHMPWRDDPIMVTEVDLRGMALRLNHAVSEIDKKKWKTRDMKDNQFEVVIPDHTTGVKYIVVLKKQDWGEYLIKSIIETKEDVKK